MKCVHGLGIQESNYVMINRGTAIGKMLVVPAEADIQRLKSLDPGQKHARMTTMWDSNGLNPIILNSSLI